MTSHGEPEPADPSRSGDPLGPADAALVSALSGDEDAPLDLDGLAAATGATRALLESVERAGLLLPAAYDDAGRPRYSAADAEAVRAGLVLLDAGLPLGELLEIARHTDRAVTDIAEASVEVFLRFIRDPAHGSASSELEAAARLVTAYERMLPATERLVAHHLRRRLLAAAAERVLGAGRDDEPRSR